MRLPFSSIPLPQMTLLTLIIKITIPIAIAPLTAIRYTTIQFMDMMYRFAFFLCPEKIPLSGIISFLDGSFPASAFSISLGLQTVTRRGIRSNNLVKDFKFADVKSFDFHLTDKSPGIDTV